MPFIDGVSLHELLAQEGPMSVKRVVSIAAQVADALAYAHEHGVIHRDVKPANVMIERGDRVTLTDFGIAKMVDTTQMTHTGVVVGTPATFRPNKLSLSRSIIGRISIRWG